MKQAEAAKGLLDYQLKAEKDKIAKLEKESEKIKSERLKWEQKVGSIDADFNVS